MGKTNIKCKGTSNCRCKLCHKKKKKESKLMTEIVKEKNNYKFLYWDI
jgi:hypothetical protein